MKRSDKILVVSNILNDTKVFHKIAKELGLTLDTEDQFFWDIEEEILENLERINNQ